MRPNIFLNCMRGVMAGSLFGDALGTPYESKYNTKPQCTEIREHKPYMNTRCSDDSEIKDKMGKELSHLHALICVCVEVGLISMDHYNTTNGYSNLTKINEVVQKFKKSIPNDCSCCT